MHKDKELTIERLERALDSLSEKIAGYGDRGRELLPLYQRLERELGVMKAQNNAMTSVRARVKRLSDQRA